MDQQLNVVEIKSEVITNEYKWCPVLHLLEGFGFSQTLHGLIESFTCLLHLRLRRFISARGSLSPSCMTRKRAMSFFVGRLDMRIFCRNIRRGDLLFDIPLCFCAFLWWHIYCPLSQSQAVVAITILADISAWGGYGYYCIIIQVREWPLASINFTALVLKMKQNVLLHLLYQTCVVFCQSNKSRIYFSLFGHGTFHLIWSISFTILYPIIYI